MLAMVCWMILQSGTPFCSAPVPFSEAVWIRNSLNADIYGPNVGPPYMVRQGSNLFKVALATRVSQADIAFRQIQ
jgi:hypothetical protein